MKKVSKSPDRNTFQRDAYIARCLKESVEPNADYLKMYANWTAKDEEWASQEHKNNMEYDLRTTDWILEKVRQSDVYAQNLYAAMCNNDFVKNDTWPILANETWSCSWRHAGGIIADMQEKGDYIDWYCSGIRDHDSPDNGYVAESKLTDEIKEDLFKLGWIVVEENKE